MLDELPLNKLKILLDKLETEEYILSSDYIKLFQDLKRNLDLIIFYSIEGNRLGFTEVERTSLHRLLYNTSSTCLRLIDKCFIASETKFEKDSDYA